MGMSVHIQDDISKCEDIFWTVVGTGETATF